MELEEWEYLSDDGFVDDLGLKNRKAKRAIPRESLSLQTHSLIDSEYLQKFIDPTNKKTSQRGVSVSPNLVIPVPVEFDLSIPDQLAKDSDFKEPDPETISSQVFFNKLKGNEFADMKLESPKSSSRGFAHQIDLGKAQFEEKDGGLESDEACLFDFDENYKDPDQKEWEDDEDHGGLNIWKMGMTGIGAVCSFGFACAAIFVIVLGARRRESKQLDQKLSFHVYADEKRMEQLVHHGNKLNDAISSAVRGVPLGGYFDGL